MDSKIEQIALINQNQANHGSYFNILEITNLQKIEFLFIIKCLNKLKNGAKFVKDNNFLIKDQKQAVLQQQFLYLLTELENIKEHLQSLINFAFDLQYKGNN